MRNACGCERQSGFTLLETLVALVVLGFLMVGLTEGVRVGLSLQHAQSHRLSQTADLDAAMRLLTGLLTRLPVDPARNRLIATAAGAGMKGEADRLSFVGNLPTGLGATRRADMTLFVRDRHLVLSWSPHYHERPIGPPRPPTETVLLGGVVRLELAYWGAPAAGQNPAWRARWEGFEAPELIRLRLIFAKEDSRRWPDLITAPRL